MNFTQAVKKMRHHQKVYFRNRKIEDLKIAKHYEKIVDEQIKMIENNQQQLNI